MLVILLSDNIVFFVEVRDTIFMIRVVFRAMHFNHTGFLRRIFYPAHVSRSESGSPRLDSSR